MEAPEKRARVAIVEDDAVLRAELVRLITQSDDLELDAAVDTLSAARAALDARIDVLLVDLALPDGNGISLIREARAAFSDLKIIVVSIFGDAQSVVRAIEAGADGYLLKGADETEAANAIRIVLEGGAPISPNVAGHILGRIRAQDQSARPNPLAPALTEKEIAVLSDLAKGFRYKEVARLQSISPNTVAHHVKSIYRKLAVTSRSEAVFEAVQAGLIVIKDPS